MELEKFYETADVLVFPALRDSGGSSLLEAMAAHDSAQKRLDAAVKAMQAVCPLITDAQGKPQCQPEPPKSEQKKGN